MNADQIAQRIVQLGGAPNFSPEGLTTRSHADTSKANDTHDMMKEDMVAERFAIDRHRWDMIPYFAEQ